MDQNHAQLAKAFEAFNTLSSQLSSSYAALEQRVAELSEELATAHSERFRELRAKEALARRLSQLMAALPGGVLVLDHSDRIVEANEQAVAMLSEPLVGELWSTVQHRAFATAALAGDRALADGRRIAVSINRLQGGSERIVLLSDVTESRRIQTELDRKQRLTSMGETVAGLAHQIRTPLAASLLYTEQLASDSIDADRRTRAAERLSGRLRHMERLVNDMLMFARGDGADTESVPVRELFDAVMASVAPLLPTGACPRFVGNGIEATVCASRDALVGALSNLAMNAVQAGEGAGIEFEASRDGKDELVLAVLDRGPGLDDGERVFEPFFSTRGSGTGLGLAVVRAVAESHGGSVFAENRRNGGARVGLRLPLSRQTELLPSGERPSARQKQSVTR